MKKKYPRIQVWKVLQFWMVAQVRPDLRLSNEPHCFDTFEEALEDALMRRRTLLGEARSPKNRKKAR